MIAAPSICDWIRSGLTKVPQSIAVSTRWHGQLALVVDRHLDNGRDIADEAAMRGDAEPVALRHGTTPAAFLRDIVRRPAQPPGIDRVAVIGLAVVPEVLHRIEVDDPRRADQFQQHLLLVAVGGVREFADHRLHREGARDVRHRTEPADAGMRRGFRIFALDVGDLERHVDQSHAEFERRLHGRRRRQRSRRWSARRCGAATRSPCRSCRGRPRSVPPTRCGGSRGERRLPASIAP